MGQEQSPVLNPTGRLSWEKILRPPQHIDNAHIGILVGQMFMAHVGGKGISGHFRQVFVDIAGMLVQANTNTHRTSSR